MSDIEPPSFRLPTFNTTQFESYGEVALCVWDNLSFYGVITGGIPLCFTNLDESLKNRAWNTLVGVADIAHITAGFSLMFFLYYMIKPPEKDVHYHCNIFRQKELSLLQDAVKANPMLLLELITLKVAQPDDLDNLVLIDAKKTGSEIPFESFYVTKEAYNRIAAKNHFQQVK